MTFTVLTRRYPDSYTVDIQYRGKIREFIVCDWNQSDINKFTVNELLANKPPIAILPVNGDAMRERIQENLAAVVCRHANCMLEQIANASLDLES